MFKKLIIPLLIISAIVGFAFYKFAMRQVADNTTVSADVKTQFSDICTKMNANDTNYCNTLTNKVVAISGPIKSVSNEDTLVTIIIGDTINTSSIICQADSRHLNDFKALKENQTINIKGTCSGYEADDMGLGSSLQLKNCVINK